MVADKTVDDLALCNGANNNRVRHKTFTVVGDRRGAIGDAFNVFLKIVYGANHASVILGVHEERCRCVLRHNLEIAMVIGAFDISLFTNRERAERCAEQTDSSEHDSETHEPYLNVSELLRQSSPIILTFYTGRVREKSLRHSSMVVKCASWEVPRKEAHHENCRRQGDRLLSWTQLRHRQSYDGRWSSRTGGRHAERSRTRGCELLERSRSSAARRARRAPHRGYLAVFLQGSLLAARACDDVRDCRRGHRTLGHQSKEPERPALPTPWRRFSRGRAGLRSRHLVRHCRDSQRGG